MLKFCFLPIVVVTAALHVALQNDYVDVANVLREFGASASWTDIDDSGSEASSESNFSNASATALPRWLHSEHGDDQMGFHQRVFLAEEEEEDGYSSCGA